MGSHVMQVEVDKGIVTLDVYAFDMVGLLLVEELSNSDYSPLTRFDGQGRVAIRDIRHDVVKVSGREYSVIAGFYHESITNVVDDSVNKLPFEFTEYLYEEPHFSGIPGSPIDCKRFTLSDEQGTIESTALAGNCYVILLHERTMQSDGKRLPGYDFSNQRIAKVGTSWELQSLGVTQSVTNTLSVVNSGSVVKAPSPFQKVWQFSSENLLIVGLAITAILAITIWRWIKLK